MFPVSRGVLRLLLTVLAVSGFGVHAHAAQTSGSILLVPGKSSGIKQNQEIPVAVYFRNTSTRTPNPEVPAPGVPQPGTALDARLFGPISVDFACLDNCECTEEDTAELSFLGCDLTGGAATGCTPGAPGEVLIDLNAAGLALPASDAPVLLATLRLKNNVQDPEALRRHFIRATTEKCALESCESLLPGTCVQCAAEGCTQLEGAAGEEEQFGCRHDCENEINFYAEPKQDYMKVQGIMRAPGFDPETMPFEVNVTLNGTTLFADAYPSIPKVSNQNGGIYQQIGPSNTVNTPGLIKIKISRRTGTGSGGEDCTMDWFKIVVEARGDFNLAQILNPRIRVDFKLDQKTFFLEENWQSIVSGGNVTTVRFINKNLSPC